MFQSPSGFIPKPLTPRVSLGLAGLLPTPLPPPGQLRGKLISSATQRGTSASQQRRSGKCQPETLVSSQPWHAVWPGQRTLTSLGPWLSHLWGALWHCQANAW